MSSHSGNSMSLSLSLMEDPTPSHILASAPSASSHTAESSLMLPPKRKPKKKIILTEEDYVGALETIIERDFYPHSATTQAHVALFEALESKDFHNIEAIRKKILEEQRKFGATPTPLARRTPVTFSQAQNDVNGDRVGDAADSHSAAKGTSKITDNTNLTNFFRQYNSEDNESFEKLHAKDREDRRRKAHWLYDDDTLDAQGQKRQAGMLMWYHAGGKHLSQEERRRVDTLLLTEAQEAARGGGSVQQRPTQVDSWKFRVRNQLMFPPELQDSRDTCEMTSTSTSTRGNQHQHSAVMPPRAATAPFASTCSGSNGALSIDNRDSKSSETSLVLREEPSSTLVKNTDCNSSGSSGHRNNESTNMTDSFQVERGKVTIVPKSDIKKGSKQKSGTHMKTFPPPSSSSLSMLETNASLSTYYSHLDIDEFQRIVHHNTRLKGSFLQDREQRDRVSDLTPLHAHRMSTPSSVLSAPLEDPHTPSIASSSIAGDDEWESHYSHYHGRNYNHNNNYRPVCMTPSPLPSAVFTDTSHDPLLTWGSLAGTPVILDPKTSDLVEDAELIKQRIALSQQSEGEVGVDTNDVKRRNRYYHNAMVRPSAMPPSEYVPVLDINTSSLSDSFEIKDISRREKLLHAMVPAAGVGLRVKGSLLSSTSSSSAIHNQRQRERKCERSGRHVYRGDRKTPLTPAGHALASKLLGSSVRSTDALPRQCVNGSGRSSKRDARALASPFTFSGVTSARGGSGLGSRAGQTPEMSLRASYSEGGRRTGNIKVRRGGSSEKKVVSSSSNARRKSSCGPGDAVSAISSTGTDDLLKLS